MRDADGSSGSDDGSPRPTRTLRPAAQVVRRVHPVCVALVVVAALAVLSATARGLAGSPADVVAAPGGTTRAAAERSVLDWQRGGMTCVRVESGRGRRDAVPASTPTATPHVCRVVGSNITWGAFVARCTARALHVGDSRVVMAATDWHAYRTRAFEALAVGPNASSTWPAPNITAPWSSVLGLGSGGAAALVGHRLMLTPAYMLERGVDVLLDARFLCSVAAAAVVYDVGDGGRRAAARSRRPSPSRIAVVSPLSLTNTSASPQQRDGGSNDTVAVNGALSEAASGAVNEAASGAAQDGVGNDGGGGNVSGAAADSSVAAATAGEGGTPHRRLLRWMPERPPKAVTPAVDVTDGDGEALLAARVRHRLAAALAFPEGHVLGLAIADGGAGATAAATPPSHNGSRGGVAGSGGSVGPTTFWRAAFRAAAAPPRRRGSAQQEPVGAAPWPATVAAPLLPPPLPRWCHSAVTRPTDRGARGAAAIGTAPSSPPPPPRIGDAGAALCATPWISAAAMADGVVAFVTSLTSASPPVLRLHDRSRLLNQLPTLGAEFARGGQLWRGFASYSRRRIAAGFNPPEHARAFNFVTAWNVVVTPRGGVYAAAAATATAAGATAATAAALRGSHLAPPAAESPSDELFHVTCEGPQRDPPSERPLARIERVDDVVVLTHRHERNLYHWLMESLAKLAPVVDYAAAAGAHVHVQLLGGDAGDFRERHLELLGVDFNDRVVTGYVRARRVLLPDPHVCRFPYALYVLLLRERLRTALGYANPPLTSDAMRRAAKRMWRRHRAAMGGGVGGGGGGNGSSVAAVDVRAARRAIVPAVSASAPVRNQPPHAPGGSGGGGGAASEAVEASASGGRRLLAAAADAASGGASAKREARRGASASPSSAAPSESRRPSRKTRSASHSRRSAADGAAAAASPSRRSRTSRSHSVAVATSARNSSPRLPRRSASPSTALDAAAAGQRKSAAATATSSNSRRPSRSHLRPLRRSTSPSGVAGGGGGGGSTSAAGSGADPPSTALIQAVPNRWRRAALEQGAQAGPPDDVSAAAPVFRLLVAGDSDLAPPPPPSSAAVAAGGRAVDEVDHDSDVPPLLPQPIVAAAASVATGGGGGGGLSGGGAAGPTAATQLPPAAEPLPPDANTRGPRAPARRSRDVPLIAVADTDVPDADDGGDGDDDDAGPRVVGGNATAAAAGALRRHPRAKRRPLSVVLLRRQNKRRIENEAELIAGLRGIRGTVLTGIADWQMPDNAVVFHIFANADVIVAAHGAGEANMIVARPGSCVVEFLPAEWLVPCYLRLSGQLGLQHHVFVVDGGYHDPIAVDVARAVAAVRECMAGVPPREEDAD